MTILTLADVDIAAHSLRALIPAVAIGLVGFGVTWLIPRRAVAPPHDPATPISLTARERNWIAPLTFAAALIGNHPLIHGEWAWPWSSAEHWLPVAALCAMTMGVLARRVRFRLLTRWLVRAVILTALAACAMRRIWSHTPPLESAAWLSGFTLASLLAWAALERTTDRTRGVSAPGLITIYALAAAAMIALTGSHSLALSCATLAAAALPALAITIFKPNLTLAYGGAHVPAVIIPLTLFTHLMIGPTPRPLFLTSALLVLLIPVATASVDLPGVIESTGPRRTTARLTLAALVALAAIGVALAGYHPM